MENDTFRNYFLRSKVNDQSINQSYPDSYTNGICQLQKVSSGKTVDLCSSNMRANYSNYHI